MLRSIGAARGAVCVAAGAENVRPPRLPELLLDRASTEATVNASAATTASTQAPDEESGSWCFLDRAQRPGLLFGHYIGMRDRPVKGRWMEAAA